jgi:hypothetical protein
MFIFLSGRDREFWPRDLVTAAQEGRWTIEEALAYLHELNTHPMPSFRLAITTNWRNSWKNPLKPSENVAM